MTTRLQVLLEDDEIEEIRQVAKRQRMSVAAWVRQTLRKAREEETANEPRRKLAVISEAARHGYPTGDIGQMLAEIEGSLESPA